MPLHGLVVRKIVSITLRSLEMQSTTGICVPRRHSVDALYLLNSNMQWINLVDWRLSAALVPFGSSINSKG